MNRFTIIFSTLLTLCITSNGQKLTPKHNDSKTIAIPKNLSANQHEVIWYEDFDNTKWLSTVEPWNLGYQLNTDAVLPEGWTFVDAFGVNYNWHWSDVGPRGAFSQGSDNDCHTPDSDILKAFPDGTSYENGFHTMVAWFGIRKYLGHISLTPVFLIRDYMC